MISCSQLTVARPDFESALFDAISFEIDDGEWAEIVGPAGAGKSVLRSLVALEARPKSGRMVVGGRNLERVGREELRELRRHIGSCRQPPELLAERTVLENLILPLVVRDRADEARRHGERMLERAGLAGRRDGAVGKLSSGARWLLGISRAAIGTPDCVVIDGGLDVLSGKSLQAAETVLQQAFENGSTVIVFGREPSGVDGVAGTIYRLADGAIERTEP